MGPGRYTDREGYQFSQGTQPQGTGGQVNAVKPRPMPKGATPSTAFPGIQSLAPCGGFRQVIGVPLVIMCYHPFSWDFPL